MKQTPDLDEAQRRMAPGVISLHGFLGDEERPLRAILADDAQRVSSLGLSHTVIAERMRCLTEVAKARLGAKVVVEGIFEIHVDDTRGSMPCPWPHPGLYSKVVTHLRRLDTGETLAWSDLHVHLIGEHGFYQGPGSPYRLSPSALQRILGLRASGRSGP